MFNDIEAELSTINTELSIPSLLTFIENYQPVWEGTRDMVSRCFGEDLSNCNAGNMISWIAEQQLKTAIATYNRTYSAGTDDTSLLEDQYVEGFSLHRNALDRLLIRDKQRNPLTDLDAIALCDGQLVIFEIKLSSRRNLVRGHDKESFSWSHVQDIVKVTTQLFHVPLGSVYYAIVFYPEILSTMMSNNNFHDFVENGGIAMPFFYTKSEFFAHVFDLFPEISYN